MKIEVLYYELKKKEFRSEKTLIKFLKSKTETEILSAIERKNNMWYAVELRSFLDKYRYRNDL